MSGLALYAEHRAAQPEDIVARHAPLVKRIAYHLMSRMPPSVQADDLIQAGMIGLLEAARNYDSSQGASFETYAGIRIRGAMLDEIRKGDWAPRSLHRKMREVSEAVREVECLQGRDARDMEVAEKLGISLKQYHQILKDASGHKVFSLEDLMTAHQPVSVGPDGRSSEPLDHIERDEFKAALAKTIAGLPERERLVMSLYYEEELNLREIGDVLSVSESRVCQIHSQALLRVKSRMSEWREAL